jgi:hypothetical protein
MTHYQMDPGSARCGDTGDAPAHIGSWVGSPGRWRGSTPIL